MVSEEETKPKKPEVEVENKPSLTIKMSSPPNFTFNINASNMAVEWKNFHTNLQIYILANGLQDQPDERKVAITLHAIGQEAIQVFHSFNIEMKDITYEELIKRFREYFTPKVNITIERHKLFNRKQDTNEELEVYATSLKNISLQCDMGDKSDDILKYIFSWNLNDEHSYIKERILIEKPKTFNDAVLLAKTVRGTKLDKQAISTDSQHHLSHQQINQVKYSDRRSRNIPSTSGNRSPGQGTSECQRCGQVHRYKCPAYGLRCNNCGKLNHYAKLCRSKKISLLEEQEEQTGTNSTPDTYHITCLTTNEISVNNSYNVHLSIQNISITFLLDTGADTNILSYNTYKNLCLPLSLISKSNHRLSTFSGEVIPTVGQCGLSVTYNNKIYKLNFHIVDMSCRNILGRHGCEILNLIKRIHNVTCRNSSSVTNGITTEYNDLFTGIGCLTNYECHLSLKPDAKPSVDACRRIPFKLVKDLELEIESLVRDQIITKVEEPTEWVSSIVLVTKMNGKLCSRDYA